VGGASLPPEQRGWLGTVYLTPGSVARLAVPLLPVRRPAPPLHVPLPPAVPRRSADDGPVRYHRAWPAPRQRRTALPQPRPPALTARPARAASAPPGLADMRGLAGTNICRR